MRILITHERSGKVRDAFAVVGHNAYSCDTAASEVEHGKHLQMDALKAIRDCGPWDLIGMHPSCTFLCGSGIHWNNRGRGWEETEAAVEHVRQLISACGKTRFYLENPVGILSSRIRKPDQIIQPYEFGEDASKKTCLWLQGLTPLKPTLRFPGRIVEWPRGSGKRIERWSNQTDSGQNKLPPGADRWINRSRTYSGIASAMQAQWGFLI